MHAYGLIRIQHFQSVPSFQLRASAEAMYPDGTDDAPCSPQATEG